MMRRGSFKTPKLMLHILTWTSRWVFLWFLCLEKSCFMLHCFIENLTVNHCHFVVWLLEFGVLYDWSCCNVGFGAFLKCCIFFCHGVIWTMLVAYGILTMLVDCDVVGWVLAWEYWHCENFLLWACINMFMMHVRNFVGMCKFISWTCQNFCVYGRILMGIKILVMEKFCWVCDVGSWKFCGYDFGYVGIYLLCMDM